MEEKLWNTPQPGEWKSEELSQGRIIDYKALILWMGRAFATPFMWRAACFIARAATMWLPGI